MAQEMVDRQAVELSDIEIIDLIKKIKESGDFALPKPEETLDKEGPEQEEAYRQKSTINRTESGIPLKNFYTAEKFQS